MKKPYVVSADISLLLARWAEEREYSIPNQRFFSELRKRFCDEMRTMFPSFAFVPEYELRAGLANLVTKSGLAPLSLDTVYTKSTWRLDLCRTVDGAGRDCGLTHRPGTLNIDEQFQALGVLAGQAVVLVDDVVYSGELMEGVIHDLARLDIRVPVICAGIGIGEGVRRLARLRSEVRCVRTYADVIDEVCERDFYPGVPQAGRLLAGGKNIGVPYILPFGKPNRWASIPVSHEVVFSRFCIRQTIQLFEEIERCSNRLVLCSDLGRQVVGMLGTSTRFVEALKSL